MGSFGSSAPGHRGLIYLKGLGDGAIPSVDLLGREIKVWGKILEQLADKPDDEWLMIEASQIKVHPPAAGGVKGNRKMSRTKGGSTPN